MKHRMVHALGYAVSCLIVGVTLLWPAIARGEPAVCSVLSQSQVRSILRNAVGQGIALTRSNPTAPGATGHACAYEGQPRSAVLGLYHGSSAQLARVKEINESTGSVTAMKGGELVSAFVSITAGGAPTPDRATAKILLEAALSKL